MAKVTALQLTIRTVGMTHLLDRGDKSAQSRGTQKSVHSMPRTSKLMLLTGSKYRPEDDARAILAQCIRVQLDRSCVQFRVVFVAFGLESACGNAFWGDRPVDATRHSPPAQVRGGGRRRPPRGLREGAPDVTG